MLTWRQYNISPIQKYKISEVATVSLDGLNLNNYSLSHPLEDGLLVSTVSVSLFANSCLGTNTNCQQYVFSPIQNKKQHILPPLFHGCMGDCRIAADGKNAQKRRKGLK
ncbi:hypothetical protein [uncultured Nostoc sp.]|uniref:hypothetical protein n=1 Tax=uncultured Nostoc sp. TaxID=340711 RepID=UPI0035CBC0BD